MTDRSRESIAQNSNRHSGQENFYTVQANLRRPTRVERDTRHGVRYRNLNTVRRNLEDEYLSEDSLETLNHVSREREFPFDVIDTIEITDASHSDAETDRRNAIVEIDSVMSGLSGQKKLQTDGGNRDERNTNAMTTPQGAQRKTETEEKVTPAQIQHEIEELKKSLNQEPIASPRRIIQPNINDNNIVFEELLIGMREMQERLSRMEAMQYGCSNTTPARGMYSRGRKG